MMCYRDMTFCSNGEQCKNAPGCHRYFSEEQADKAERWMKNPPVAFAPFNTVCSQWEPKNEPI